jgi:SAM-dependent methyltransferase
METNYNLTTAKWDDCHHYSPAPRHRRRLISSIINKLDFNSMIDVGCAQPYLIKEMIKKRPAIRICGCDVAEAVIEQNKKMFPQVGFEVVDIGSDHISPPPPHKESFNLVVCCEVLEHINDWQKALKNLVAMSDRYVLITVPSGKVFPIDKKVGHYRHFKGTELITELEINNCQVLYKRKWGFPVHTLYKYLINSFAPDAIYESFSESKYGWGKKALSNLIYAGFFINDLFRSGSQFIVLAKKMQ